MSELIIDKYVLQEYKSFFLCPFVNPEAIGYILGSGIPTAAAIMGGVFLSAAMIKLANHSVGCLYGDEIDDIIEDDYKCKKSLWGLFNPNSIYLVVTLVASVLCSIFCPIVGSIIDHTNLRKQVGFITLSLVTIITFINIMISKDTLLAVTILQMISIATGLFHAIVYSSYLPELGDDQSYLVKVRSFGSMSMFGFELLFVFIMVVFTLVVTEDTVILARWSSALGGCFCLFVLIQVYGRLFKTRNNLQEIPSGQTAATAGLYKLYHTLQTIRVTNPHLFNYLIGITFVDGSMSCFGPISSSFMLVQLNMTGTETSVTILILLVTSFLFGPLVIKLSEWIRNKYGDDQAGQPLLVISIGFIAFVTILSAIFLRSEDDVKYVPIFAVAWGIGMSGYYSLEKATYYFMVPHGLSAQYSGIGLFAGKILMWAPILAFFLMYEALDEMNWGMAVIGGFLLIGGACIWSVTMKEARDDALNWTEKNNIINKNKSNNNNNVIVANDTEANSVGVEMNNT